jgi:spore coat polysaccharide biosynthesis predicted glycosyltransferase SpsG
MNMCIHPQEEAPLPWKCITRYGGIGNEVYDSDYYQILDRNGIIVIDRIDNKNVAFNVINYANSRAALVDALDTIANKHVGYEGYPEDKFLSALADLKTLIKIAKAAIAAAGETK